MYFVNLLDPRYKGNETGVENVFRRRINRVLGQPLHLDDSFTYEMGVESDVVVKSVNGELVVTHNDGSATGVNGNLFALNGDPKKLVVPAGKNDVPLTWADVQETEENPLILVLCKALHFKNGVKSCIKYININDNAILALLVSGACGFEDFEGDVTLMQRCFSTDVSRMKSERADAKRMQTLVSVVDANSYDYSADMLMTVNASYVKDMLTVKLCKDESIIFDPASAGRAEAAAKKVAEKKAAAEAEAAKRAEEAALARKANEEAAAERAERQRAMAEAKQAVEKANRRPAAKKPSKKAGIEDGCQVTGNNADGRNTGAANFLSLLQNM